MNLILLLSDQPAIYTYCTLKRISACSVDKITPGMENIS